MLTYCPHCKKVIDIKVKLTKASEVNMTNANPKRKQGVFPPNWNIELYRGKSFEEVWEIDQDYLVELYNNNTLYGELDARLRTFLSDKNII